MLVRICGGIANNDFVVQTVSTITEKQVLRFKHNEVSSLGATFLAGLHCGKGIGKVYIFLQII